MIGIPHNDRLDVEVLDDTGTKDALNTVVKAPRILYADVPCRIEVYDEQGGHGIVWRKTGETDATKYIVYIDSPDDYPGINSRCNLIIRQAYDDSLINARAGIIICRKMGVFLPHYELFFQLGFAHG